MAAATEWPDSRYRIAFWTLLVLFTLILAALTWNDRLMVEKGYPKSQELQRVSPPACARCTVEQWRNGGYVRKVTAGIVIDTVAFIPCYSTLLALCCFWCAKHLADEQLRRAAVIFGWGGWLAGLFDLLENGGMLLELHGSYYKIAPLTVAFSSVKWTIATVVKLFVVAVFLRRRSLF